MTVATFTFKMQPLEWLFGQAGFTYKSRAFEVADKLHFKVRSPRSATLFGSGQVETIAAAAVDLPTIGASNAAEVNSAAPAPPGDASTR